MMMEKQILDDYLTDEQKKAIHHIDGPLLIVAGPGSGKTEVMIRRIAQLIMVHKIPPQNILAVTFTNRAADQMKDRLQSLLPMNVERMQISTIHSFCKAVLDEYLPDFSKYRVLDQNTQFLYVYARRWQLGLEKIPRGRKGQYIQNVISFFNQITEHAIEPEKLIASYEHLKAQKPEASRYYDEMILLTGAYQKYFHMIFKERWLDFGHLQKIMYELVSQNDTVLHQLQDRYQYIQVDEYQDTNVIQARILNSIAARTKNICVVGDDDQSIYRFRGATVENILTFESDYQGAKKVKLEKNFRSTQNIVEATSNLIKFNENRHVKNLRSERQKGNPVVIIHRETVSDEAEDAAKFIRLLKDREIVSHFGEIAILFRSTRYYGDPYFHELEKMDIPYIVQGDGKFFERDDIIHIRGLIYSLEDDNLDKFLKNIQFLDLSEESVEIIYENEDLLIDDEFLQSGIDEKESKLSGIGINGEGDLEKLTQYFELKRRVKENKYDDITELFFRLMALTGYFEKCIKEEDEIALINLGAFSNIISNFDDISQTHKIKNFRWYLYHVGEKNFDQKWVEKSDSVAIMTIHQAKGLEFPVVIIGSATEGRFPKLKKRHEYEIPQQLLMNEFEESEDDQLEDERRLFYVAATRAQNLLVVGCSDKINVRGKGRSRFVNEMDDKNVVYWDETDFPGECCSVPIKEKIENTRLSYSQFNVYLFCPLRYKFLVEYGYSVPIQDSTLFGASIHLALEKIHNEYLAGNGLNTERIEMILEENWIPLMHRGRRFENAQKEAAKRYLKRYYKENRGSFKNIFGVEKPFNFIEKSLILEGKIDLIKRQDDGVEIIDFKTSDSSTFKEMIQNRKKQLAFYALGVQNELEYPIRTLTFHYIPNNEQDSYSWQEDDRELMMEEVQMVSESIKEKKFDPTPEAAKCGKCEFGGMCNYA